MGLPVFVDFVSEASVHFERNAKIAGCDKRHPLKLDRARNAVPGMIELDKRENERIIAEHFMRRQVRGVELSLPFIVGESACANVNIADVHQYLV